MNRTGKFSCSASFYFNHPLIASLTSSSLICSDDSSQPSHDSTINSSDVQPSRTPYSSTQNINHLSADVRHQGSDQLLDGPKRVLDIVPKQRQSQGLNWIGIGSSALSGDPPLHIPPLNEKVRFVDKLVGKLSLLSHLLSRVFLIHP
jgi:hypothetical protein